jgi:predicted dehydrogenase
MMVVRRGAIIGFGNVAVHGHLPAWRSEADFRIVAVTDPDPDRRALAVQLIPEVRAYATVDELFRHEQLEFVDIASPPACHTAAILAAAAAGAHVLCEKPLNTSLQDYRAVRAAVQGAGVVLHTVHNWKYSEAFRTVRELLAHGRIGGAHSIFFDTARNGYAASTGDWRVSPALAGGGILVDHGWHAFYLLLALANERPCRIRARLERRRYVDAGVEDTAACAIVFPSLHAEIRLTWAAAERSTRWRFVGADGQLCVDDDELILEAKGTHESRRLATALSTGSHHPEWFAGVVESFRHELNDPAARGTNRAEAEWCLLMLTRAYASNAQDSRLLDIPCPDDWFEGRAAPA